MRSTIYIIGLLVAGIVLAQRPFVNGLDKQSGTANEVVTISGSNFSGAAGPFNGRVYFGTALSQNATLVNSGVIQAEVPANATYGPVTVENATGESGTSTQFFTLAFDDDSEIASWTDLPTAGSLIPTGQNFTYDPCLCDFDGDGLNDAVVTNNEAANLSVALNTGNAATPFTAVTNLVESDGNRSHNIECADLNGDGKPDITFTSQFSGEPFVHFYENTSTLGNITFTKRDRHSLPTIGGDQRQPKRVRIADFDQDGLLDVAVGSSSDNDTELFIFLNTSSGNLSFSSVANSVTVTGASKTGGLAIADFDLDGRPDIAVVPSGASNERVYIVRNQSAPGSLSFPQTFAIENRVTERTNVITGDFNNDGLPDFATSNRDQGIQIFQNNGNFDFTVQSNIPTSGASAWGLSAGDLNGDGLTDIVYASTSNEIVYHENSSTEGGTISFAAGEIEPMSGTVRNVRIGDINGDGKPDIVLTDNSIPSANGDFRYILNDLCMTPVIDPPQSSPLAEYCTSADFILTATGGEGLTYDWSDGGGSIGTGQTLNLIGMTGNKTITVTATNGSCVVQSSSVTINHDPTDTPDAAPSISTSLAMTDLCVTQDLTLTASPTDGTNYHWYGPNGYITSTSGTDAHLHQIAASAEAANSGDYYVKYDKGNCQSSASTPVSITVTGPPAINVEVTNCDDGSVSMEAPDYTSQFSYQWMDGSGAIGGATGNSFIASSADDFSLVISDGTCDRTSNVVSIPNPPTSSFDGPSFGAVDEACLGADVTFTATSANGAGAGGLTLAYNWTIEDPGGTVTNPTGNTANAIFTTVGTATVTLETYYSDGIGCTIFEKSITVSAAPAYEADFSIVDGDAGTTNFQKCPSESVTLSFSEFGTEITDVSWDSLGLATVAGNNITVTESGTYTATYSTNTGCTMLTHQVIIDNWDGLMLAADDPAIVGGQVQLADGDLSVELSVDASVTNISWTVDGEVQSETGASLEITPNRPSILVSVTGTTTDGCMETEEVTILGGTFLASKSFSPNGDGINDWWGIVNGSVLTACSVYILDTRGKAIIQKDAPFDEVMGESQIWDGNSGGKPVPEGVYYFVLKCADGDRSQTGSILLAR